MAAQKRLQRYSTAELHDGPGGSLSGSPRRGDRTRPAAGSAPAASIEHVPAALRSVGSIASAASAPAAASIEHGPLYVLASPRLGKTGPFKPCPDFGQTTK
jgi:hypothetical protein